MEQRDTRVPFADCFFRPVAGERREPGYGRVIFILRGVKRAGRGGEEGVAGAGADAGNASGRRRRIFRRRGDELKGDSRVKDPGAVNRPREA